MRMGYETIAAVDNPYEEGTLSGVVSAPLEEETRVCFFNNDFVKIVMLTIKKGHDNATSENISCNCVCSGSSRRTVSARSYGRSRSNRRVI